MAKKDIFSLWKQIFGFCHLQLNSLYLLYVYFYLFEQFILLWLLLLFLKLQLLHFSPIIMSVLTDSCILLHLFRS